MKTLTYVLCAGLTLSSLALAQDNTRYQCSYGELVRRVEIYTEPGVTVPCEVHYFKDTEAPGESEVLWSAQSQAGYCEQKTEEFIVKLQEWGWTCGAGEATPEPLGAVAISFRFTCRSQVKTSR